ncbi:ATP-binding protein [Streptomyces sp. 110]|uniref:ATP-binding protein n=1 Tax=Streptomyces endocoffeicus TaxID=2898945 RepID=A0ABS1Q397_9ACTN|nr:ATP-binding protein [Streptomyces endocoffeicus]MBL1118830.1 ATP-binding protein [Streptomyces endocoffeicus]
MQKPSERQFTRHPASVAKARTFVAEALTVWRLDGRLDDVRACVSELVTNAVEHGTSAGPDFLVRVAHDDERVRVEVLDSGDGTPAMKQTTPDDDDGRGLFLVDAIADEWGFEPRTGPGKAVWIEFKLSVTPSGPGAIPC